LTFTEKCWYLETLSY